MGSRSRNSRNKGEKPQVRTYGIPKKRHGGPDRGFSPACTSRRGLFPVPHPGWVGYGGHPLTQGQAIPEVGCRGIRKWGPKIRVESDEGNGWSGYTVGALRGRPSVGRRREGAVTRRPSSDQVGVENTALSHPSFAPSASPGKKSDGLEITPCMQLYAQIDYFLQHVTRGGGKDEPNSGAKSNSAQRKPNIFPTRENQPCGHVCGNTLWW